MTAVPVPDRTCLIYVRISKDDENDELGVQRQEKSLREYATGHGWVVAAVYSDNDMSAFRGKRRPGYETLLRAVEAGAADVVLCTEVSRLTRHAGEFVDLVNLVRRTKVDIVALRAGHVDLSTSGGLAVAEILGVMARMESGQIGERVKAKHAQNRTAGLAHGGPRPYGYQRLGTGKLVIDEAEATVIREAAARRLAGEATTAIARDLNARGVPTSGFVRGVRGTAPIPKEDRVPGEWRERTLVTVLTSPRVAGLTPSGREPVGDATWEPILDRATWEKLRSILASAPRGRPSRALLSGVLRCGLCGGSMSGHSSGGKKQPRKSYSCSESGGGCGRMSVVAGTLDAYVIGLVIATAEGANLAQVRAARSQNQTVALIAQIADDDQFLTDLATDAGAKRISRAEWIAARGPVDDRLRAARARLAEQIDGDRLPSDLATVDRERFDALTVEQQRAFVRLFIDHVDVAAIGRSSGPKFRYDRLSVVWKA